MPAARAGRAAATGVPFGRLVAGHPHGRQGQDERAAHGGPDGTEAEHGAGAGQAPAGGARVAGGDGGADDG